MSSEKAKGMPSVETTGHLREIHLIELIPPAGGSTFLAENDFSGEDGVTEHKALSGSTKWQKYVSDYLSSC